MSELVKRDVEPSSECSTTDHRSVSSLILSCKSWLAAARTHLEARGIVFTHIVRPVHVRYILFTGAQGSLEVLPNRGLLHIANDLPNLVEIEVHIHVMPGSRQLEAQALTPPGIVRNGIPFPEQVQAFLDNMPKGCAGRGDLCQGG